MAKYIGSTAQLAAYLEHLGKKARETSLTKGTIKERRFYEGKASAFDTAAEMVKTLEIADVPDLVWNLGTDVPAKKEG